MKLTIEIDEKEVMEAAKELVIQKVAERLYGEFHNSERYCYRTMIKECVREAIKGDMENLSNRAVTAASETIKNKAVKKMLDKLKEEI